MRVWGRMIGLVVVLLVVALPALTFGVRTSSTGSTETTTITDYRADFVVGADGDMDVTERISVRFPSFESHGIFRFFDLQDPVDSHAVRQPSSFSVTRDGQPDQVEEQTTGRGRFVTYRIGSPDSTLSSGVHTYVLKYRMAGVIEPRSGGGSQFYWELIPGGWRQFISRAHLSVELPEAPTAPVDCAIGFHSSSGCTATVSGRRLSVDAEALSPDTPLTIRANLAMAAPEGDQAPWPLRWHQVLGDHAALALLVLLVALAAGWVGSRLGSSTREPTPPFPLQYAPPEGIGPAQGQFLLTERVGKEQFVATLLQAAEKGVASLDKADSSWTITGTGDWSGVDRVTSALGSKLGITGGGAFMARRKNVSDGEDLKSALGSFTSETRAWATGSGLMTQAGLGSGGGVLTVLAAVACLALAFFNPLGMSLVALVPGLFAVGAMEFVSPGASTRRTPEGRELWSRLGGFRRVLSTPSSQDRFDFSGRKDLYTAYIPWAVAFGVADQWARKYRVETGEEPPVPAYFGGYYGAHTGNYVDSMVNDFSSTMNSAISAYTASQSSSGSGGGGFSGGGGGGGGGGGSW